MTEPVESTTGALSSRDGLMLVGGLLLACLGFFAWTTWTRTADTEATSEESAVSAGGAVPSDELKVSADVLATAGIQVDSAVAASLAERVQVSGVVEPNQERIQQVTPLVTGRVERVSVALGDAVQAGTVLLVLTSPQIAELRGTLRAAEAKLAEAETTLGRTRQLVELGAAAGKDLVAAESEYQAARAQAGQLRQSLGALGADEESSTSEVSIRAPTNGTIIERTVNPGAWLEAGKPVVTVANLATVWVIVNVPEDRLSLVRTDATVEIRAPGPGGAPLLARVSYIDPQLDRETRTARVRVQVPNPGQRLKIGMFVDVVIEGASDARAAVLTVPSEAVQRIGERAVVFVPKAETGRFEIRDVELGDEIQGARVILSGLTRGDRVVTRGGFTLKSQLLKGQFGEDERISD